MPGRDEVSLFAFFQTDEATFRRLYFLGQKMASIMVHLGALNPRAFRADESGAVSEAELARAADGGLLRRCGRHRHIKREGVI